MLNLKRLEANLLTKSKNQLCYYDKISISISISRNEVLLERLIFAQNA